MAIEYRITLDDEHTFSYQIELDRDPRPAARQEVVDVGEVLG